MSPTDDATTCAVIQSPIGPITVRVEDAAVIRVDMAGGRHAPPPPAHTNADVVNLADRRVINDAIDQLTEWFAGRRTEFDLPLNLVGTEFQRSVWDQLTKIPYGETISYAELARRVGNPNAYRAVGLANGRNPVSIVVPCHRVIATDGGLGGYGGGLDRKVWLLDHELEIAGMSGGRLPLS